MTVFYQNVSLPINNNTNIVTFPTANAGNLILKSTSLLVEGNGTINFIKLGYSSSLSITSLANLSGIMFSIYGINNGYYITETISGPNNTTVSTNNMFEKIINISISANINNQFTLGSGRDVAVYAGIDTPPLITASRPTFVCTLNSPNANVNGLPVDGAFLFNILGESKILLNKINLSNNVNRPINYELQQNGSTQAQLQNGHTITPPAGGLQFVFVVINGNLTFPVFYSATWVNVS